MNENRMSGLGKGCGSGGRDHNAQRDPGGFMEEVLGGPEGFSYLWGWAEVRRFTLWHGARRRRRERRFIEVVVGTWGGGLAANWEWFWGSSGARLRDMVVSSGQKEFIKDWFSYLY